MIDEKTCDKCGTYILVIDFEPNLNLCYECWGQCKHEIGNPTTEQIKNWINKGK